MVFDPDRVIGDFDELQEITGGVSRLAWSESWQRVCGWLAVKARAAGAGLEVDRAANQWFTLGGSGAKALVIGGHLDSAPNEGLFEGCLSLLAGLEVLRRVASNGRPRVSVKLVNWADSEGTRFGRPLFGSSAAAGAMRDWYVAADLRDAEGASLLETLNGFGVDLKLVGLARRHLADVGAYLELGVGPGSEPVLPGSPLVVVASTPGVERCRITWRVRPVDAGSPPIPESPDPLQAAARFALELREISAGHGAELATARIAHRSGSAGTALETVDQMMELRHVDLVSLEHMLGLGIDASEQIATEQGLTAEWARIWRVEPARFDPGLAGLAREVVHGLTGASAASPSPAVYDATEVSRSGIPAVVITAPALAGVTAGTARCRREEVELAVSALDAIASRVCEQLGSGA